MRTANELVSQMLSEMPYIVNAGIVPYLIELVELTQNDAYNQAMYDMVDNDLLPDREVNLKKYLKK